MTFYLRFGMCWVVSGKWERSCSIVSFFFYSHIVVLCSWCWHTYATTPGPSGVSWQVRLPGTVAEMFGDVEGREIRSGSRCRSRGPLGNFQCKVDDLCRPWGMDGFPVSVDEPVTGKYISKGQDGFLLCVGWSNFLYAVSSPGERSWKTSREAHSDPSCHDDWLHHISDFVCIFLIQPFNRSTHRFLLVVNIK